MGFAFYELTIEASDFDQRLFFYAASRWYLQDTTNRAGRKKPPNNFQQIPKSLHIDRAFIATLTRNIKFVNLILVAFGIHTLFHSKWPYHAHRATSNNLNYLKCLKIMF
ncbi:hypothetical protein D0C36_23605 [Mucilaginibacter conchicola]|uniref:Uncharacterized protein n=1 Tax=Mucilaginibacter conchicola TaxID=2303333 RepID=A0A372NN36_9SPHI|nr:hypothetical protein D0C36_23605 [Mucilaginibacter conchicola]